MKVRFVECSDEQAHFGGGADPREYLTLNEVYEVVKKEVHSWHTMYFITVADVDLPFNSVCFEEAD